MNILFLGNFRVSWTTENHHKQTYVKLGHNVTTLQEGVVHAHEIIKKIPKHKYLIEDIIKNKKYILSEKEEKIMGQVLWRSLFLHRCLTANTCGRPDYRRDLGKNSGSF